MMIATTTGTQTGHNRANRRHHIPGPETRIKAHDGRNTGDLTSKASATLRFTTNTHNWAPNLSLGCTPAYQYAGSYQGGYVPPMGAGNTKVRGELITCKVGCCGFPTSYGSPCQCTQRCAPSISHA